MTSTASPPPAGRVAALSPYRPRAAAQRARRRLVPPVGLVIAAASTTFVDRCPRSLILAAMILVSALAHGLGVDALRAVRDPRPEARPAELVRVAVIERTPPPPLPPAPLPAVAPRPVVPMMPRRRSVPVAHPSEVPPPAVPPPIQPAAPPPGPTEAVPELAPTLLPGVALSATTVSGSMAVARGGSPTGRRGGESAGPGSGKLDSAAELVPDYALMERPVFLDNVSAEQVRSFYPASAQAARFEARVVVKMRIDANGSVTHAVSLADPGYGLGAAAARLARLYRFTSPKMNGRAVATEIQFTIHFVMTE